MQIVINIHKKDYDKMCRGELADTILVAIKNGTPLPKGHGRLIDADEYIRKHAVCEWLEDVNIAEFNEITPTIIEADEQESERE